MPQTYPLTVTTTATIRPDILRRTFASFQQNLKGVDWNASILYLNVDPVGLAIDPYSVVSAAYEFFNTVIFNIPEKPDFATALKWLWNEPAAAFETSLLFHLEDDWILTELVDINDLFEWIEQDGELTSVNLRAYNSMRDARLCLSPCLIDRDAAQRVSDYLRPGLNPEQQLRPWRPRNKELRLKSIQFPEQKVLRDIGREWLSNNHLQKNNGSKFTTWTS